MGLFAIAYDLDKKKDYQPLWKELERLGGHKALRSFYLCSLDTDDAVSVGVHLRKFVGKDDFLMIVPFSGRPQFTRARRGTNDWIEANIPG